MYNMNITHIFGGGNVKSLRKYREKMNITQKNLAEKLEVDTSTVTKWETGAAMPRADKLPELAKILGCEVSDLFKSGEG